MKKIIIHREDKDYGPYTEKEVKDLILQGSLTEDDLAWVDGGTEWVPLKSLLRPATSRLQLARKKKTVPEVKPPVPNPLKDKGVLAGVVLLALLLGIGAVAFIELKDAAALVSALMEVKKVASTPRPLDSASPAESGTSGEWRENSWVTLPSGKQIKILSINQEENEGKQVINLHYIALVDLSDRKQLRAEVDEVWPAFKDQAERSGLHWAVISPTKIISTFPAELSHYENYYYKKTDGVWKLY